MGFHVKVSRFIVWVPWLKKHMTFYVLVLVLCGTLVRARRVCAKEVITGGAISHKKRKGGEGSLAVMRLIFHQKPQIYRDTIVHIFYVHITCIIRCYIYICMCFSFSTYFIFAYIIFTTYFTIIYIPVITYWWYRTKLDMSWGPDSFWWNWLMTPGLETTPQVRSVEKEVAKLEQKKSFAIKNRYLLSHLSIPPEARVKDFHS